MNQRSKSALTLLLLLVFLFSAVFIVSFSLPTYYESAFHLISSDYAKENESGNLSLLESSNNINLADKFLGPIYIKNLFVDKDYKRTALKDLVSKYGVIDKVNGEFIVHLYASNVSIITELNKQIALANKQRILSKLSQNLKAVQDKLDGCNKAIVNEKKDFLQNPTKINFDQKNKSYYLDKMAELVSLQNTLKLVDKAKGTRESYIAIPEIGKTQIISDIVAQLYDIDRQLTRLSVLLPEGDFQLKSLGQEKIAVESHLDQQIKLRITNLRNQLSIDLNIKDEFQKFLKDNNIGSNALDVFITQMENLLQEKVELSQKIAFIQNNINDVCEDGRIEPVLAKHYYFENLFSNILVLLLLLGLLDIIYLVGCFLSNENVGFKTITKNVKQNLDENSYSIAKNYDDNFTSLSDLCRAILCLDSNQKDKSNKKIVAFFSEKSELAVTKFIVNYRKYKKDSRLLLVDFGGKLTHKKPTLSLVLTKKIMLKDAIFHERASNLDIVFAHDFSESLDLQNINKVASLLKNLASGYDLVIYNISQATSLPIDSFLPIHSYIAIISSAYNNYEAKNWQWLLSRLGYESINFIEAKDL